MAITIEEAALVFGVKPAKVRKWQKDGRLPDPIPDDYLDTLINFRVRIEAIHRNRIDAARGTDASSD